MYGVELCADECHSMRLNRFFWHITVKCCTWNRAKHIVQCTVHYELYAAYTTHIHHKNGMVCQRDMHTMEEMLCFFIVSICEPMLISMVLESFPLFHYIISLSLSQTRARARPFFYRHSIQLLHEIDAEHSAQIFM